MADLAETHEAAIHRTCGKKITDNLYSHIERLFAIEAACITPGKENEIVPLENPHLSREANAAKVVKMLKDPNVRVVVDLCPEGKEIIGFGIVEKVETPDALAAEIPHRKAGDPKFGTTDFPTSGRTVSYGVLKKLRVHPAHQGRKPGGTSAAGAIHKARCDMAAKTAAEEGLDTDWMATDVTQTNAPSLVIQLKAGFIIAGADVFDLDTVDAQGQFAPTPCFSLVRANKLSVKASGAAITTLSISDATNPDSDAWLSLAKTIREMRAAGKELVGLAVVTEGKVTGISFYDRESIIFTDQGGQNQSVSWVSTQLPPAPPAPTKTPSNPWQDIVGAKAANCG